MGVEGWAWLLGSVAEQRAGIGMARRMKSRPPLLRSLANIGVFTLLEVEGHTGEGHTGEGHTDGLPGNVSYFFGADRPFDG